MKRSASSMFVFVLLVVIHVATLTGQSSKESFYTQAERRVIRLEQTLPSGGHSPVGTGFFVQDETNQLFVVTARHVASLGLDLRARVPTLLKTTGKTDVVELRLPASGWVYHQNLGDDQTLAVDVAVMKVHGVKDRGVTAFRYGRQNCPKDEYNELADDPQPPDEIVIFGFPSDLGFTLTEPKPMTRLGVVSLTSDDKFIYIDQPNGSKKLLPQRAYLIDARMFPGNSGGPVIVKNPFTNIKLGGLVTATNRNLDYGIVTPVSQIAQTLDRAKESDAVGNWFLLDDAPPAK
jgi:S1-C subfamily serine protease